jgi:hypothetical protein
VLQQNKKKGDDSVTVIAFWATLQEKNWRRQWQRYCCRLLH